VLHGSINHVSITVSDLDAAMVFLTPILEFLGFRVGEELRNPSTDTRLRVNVNASNGLAFNVWEAKPELRRHPFEVYAPGLHHVAFNVASHDQVDQLCTLVRALGGEILDGPGEFPYAEDGLGYYAFYFLGPDGLKFECVHMPGLARLYSRREGAT
jgi:catechol 2,3-dioxygenase-like lactoylglutathione lyase family enzyme